MSKRIVDVKHLELSMIKDKIEIYPNKKVLVITDYFKDSQDIVWMRRKIGDNAWETIKTPLEEVPIIIR